MSTLSENFSLCKDLDPIYNFNFQSQDCQYYSYGSFNNRFIESRLNVSTNANGNNLALLHLNVRSISNKLDQFSTFLGSIMFNFSVIAITETWLEDSSHSVDIPGFNFIHKHREDKIGGGVGLYLADHFDFKLRPEFAFSDLCCESLFIEINRTKGKNIIGVVYRPPDRSARDFIVEIDQLLNVIAKENKIVYLLGDWNINLMNHSFHEITSEFLELLYSRLFFPLISRPTRITAHKASLIDNIFTNDFSHQSFSGLFLNDISDHLPIFAVVKGFDKIINTSKFFTYREKTENNLEKFKAEIESVNWSELPGYNNPALAYGSFIKKIFFSTASR